MSFWPDLVDAAVLGTGRAELPPPAPPLAELADLTDGADPTAAGPTDGTTLLRLAALASRARRAGYVPSSAADRTPPDPAPPDERPEVGAAARQRLAELLPDGDTTELVIEWLKLLAACGRRPPDAQLPQLLARATVDPRLNDALRPVFGPLATWLAAANPSWQQVVATEQASGADLADWTTASHRARRDLLELVRRSDPAAGRDLVAATWSGDSARDKSAFIAGLAVGLSDDDEPLLDRALTDRRGEVRHAAAGLLAKLPGSAFSRRAVSRAAAAVLVIGGLDRRHLDVRPPATAADDMVADGLNAVPPKGTGQQAWLLRQVIAAAPAAWWAEHTGVPPARLLVMASATKWTGPLETGWTEAAIRDADPTWLTALLDRPEHQADPIAATLLEALPTADRESWLAAHADSPLFYAIELVPAPWSATLSAAVRDRIIALVCSDPNIPGQRGHVRWPSSATQVRKLLRTAAIRLDPPVVPELRAAEIHPQLANGWAELLNTLSIRAAMRRELTEEPTP